MTQSFMETRFGRDFRGVRVHTNVKAAESAQDVSARAYTAGSNIVFGLGQYKPGTAEGKRLIAHELAHVIQQTSDADASIHTSAPTRPCKQCSPRGGTTHNRRCRHSKLPILLIRQMLLESTLLAALGALGGVVITLWCTSLINRQMATADAPFWYRAVVDDRLPVNDGSVVGVVLSSVRTRLADLGHQLVFVDGDPETRLGQKRPVTVADRRQRLGEQV